MPTTLYTPAQAIGRFRTWSAFPYRGCVPAVWRAFQGGSPSTSSARGPIAGDGSTARSCWATTPPDRKYGGTPPAGFPVYLVHPNGIGDAHVVLSTGGGRVRSTDFPKPGQVGEGTLAEIERMCGHPYVGWTDWLGGYDIPRTGFAGDTTEGDDMYDAAAEARLMAFVSDMAKPKLYRDLTTGEICAIHVPSGYVRHIETPELLQTLVGLGVFASTATMYEVQTGVMQGLKNEAAAARQTPTAGSAPGRITDADLARVGIVVDKALADNFAAIPTAVADEQANRLKD